MSIWSRSSTGVAKSGDKLCCGAASPTAQLIQSLSNAGMLGATIALVPAHLLLVNQLLAYQAQAQVIPDRTTPTNVRSCGSRCVSRRGRMIREGHVIWGGSTRGVNLFHSFKEFNVNRGQQLHFDNAPDIESIFTRVTGENVSSIDGLLSVNGRTNLFLLNPNGILFGEGARLNIGGSFVATTAERFTFPDGSEFSAVDPQEAPLLSVNVPVGLQHGANPRAITNRGRLSVGGDFTLEAGTLDIQGRLNAGGNLTLEARTIDVKGQLNAGGNLTLHGLDTLTFLDDPEQPAIATADGAILMQSNMLTLAALSHPDSLVSAGRSLTLRASHRDGENEIVSSAVLRAGGRVRFETAMGELASVVSPAGISIHAGGAVELDSYTGAPLQILAANGVNIDGSITIMGARTSQTRIAPDEVTDATQQVAATCPTSGDIAAEIGEFIITGRGGIPVNPADIISGRMLNTRLATFSEIEDVLITPPIESEVLVERTIPQGTQADSFHLHASTPSLLTASVKQSTEYAVRAHDPLSTLPPIIEAQGWTRDDDGNIALTANPSYVATAPLSAVQCSSIAN